MKEHEIVFRTESSCVLRATVVLRHQSHKIPNSPRPLSQDIMASYFRDGPKKLVKKVKKGLPYYAIFLGFSLAPIMMCNYLDHRNTLHHRY